MHKPNPIIAVSYDLPQDAFTIDLLDPDTQERFAVIEVQYVTDNEMRCTVVQDHANHGYFNLFAILGENHVALQNAKLDAIGCDPYPE